MCIDIQTDRPTYIKWFTMELRNNPSLAQNTVHTLMMKVYFGLWYLHVWSYINKVFWFVVVFERGREQGRVEKKRRYWSTLPLSHFFTTSPLILLSKSSNNWVRGREKEIRRESDWYRGRYGERIRVGEK